MKLIRITAIIAVTMIAFACTTKDSKQSAEAMAVNKEIGLNDLKEEEKSPDQERFFADSTTRQQQVPPGDKQKQQQQQKEPAIKPDWDKKIIKTAVLNLEVKDYNAFYTSLREKVRAAG